jgi:hypothetical protein
VVAVQPTDTYIRLSLEQIIEGAQRRDRFVIRAFVFDPPYHHGGSININDVRRRLAASGIPVHVLDGRRFAFLNALEIKTITGIP